MTNSSNTDNDGSEEPNEHTHSQRAAHVCRDGEGNPLGTAMFLGAGDLAVLGVENADAVTYRITPDGEISIVSRGDRDE